LQRKLVYSQKRKPIKQESVYNADNPLYRSVTRKLDGGNTEYPGCARSVDALFAVEGEDSE